MPWSRFRKKRDMPEGLWSKCKACETTIYKKDLEEALYVCSECSFHMRIGAQARVASLVDGGHAFEELWDDVYPTDPLSFVDKVPYVEKLGKSATKSGATDAAMAGMALIDGQPVALCILDFSFMGGSMGMVVGERVTRTIELAVKERVPAIVLSCSGGARMHEGALSLMQMAKTSAMLARLQEEKGLYVSILTNPTTGGVMASFAALGDVILAEPGALIGFAGPRVIQETLRIELPEGFQTSEFLEQHGFIDRIVARKSLRAELSQLVSLLWTYDDGKAQPWIERLTANKLKGEAEDLAAAVAAEAAAEAEASADGAEPVADEASPKEPAVNKGDSASATKASKASKPTKKTADKSKAPPAKAKKRRTTTKPAGKAEKDAPTEATAEVSASSGNTSTGSAPKA